MFNRLYHSHTIVHIKWCFSKIYLTFTCCIWNKHVLESHAYLQVFFIFPARFWLRVKSLFIKWSFIFWGSRMCLLFVLEKLKFLSHHNLQSDMLINTLSYSALHIPNLLLIVILTSIYTASLTPIHTAPGFVPGWSHWMKTILCLSDFYTPNHSYFFIHILFFTHPLCITSRYFQAV